MKRAGSTSCKPKTNSHTFRKRLLHLMLPTNNTGRYWILGVKQSRHRERRRETTLQRNPCMCNTSHSHPTTASSASLGNRMMQETFPQPCRRSQSATLRIAKYDCSVTVTISPESISRFSRCVIEDLKKKKKKLLGKAAYGVSSHLC